jgi:hypothetical protein
VFTIVQRGEQQAKNYRTAQYAELGIDRVEIQYSFPALYHPVFEIIKQTEDPVHKYYCTPISEIVQSAHAHTIDVSKFR